MIDESRLEEDDDDGVIQYYIDWGDDRFDIEQCRISAQSGYAFAQDMMGNCYKNGVYVQKDFAQAVAWFEKAALQGNAAAQRSLGYCYNEGHGVKQDYQKAVYWYTLGVCDMRWSNETTKYRRHSKE